MKCSCGRKIPDKILRVARQRHASLTCSSCERVIPPTDVTKMAVALERWETSTDGQCRKILDHLQRGGSITPLEALRKFGIMRLGARIYDLKKRGFEVTTTMVPVDKSDGSKAKVAQYTLARKEK